MTQQQLRLRSADLKWREIDEEIVAVDVRASTYLSANPSGRILWEALAAGATRDDLVGGLVDAFGIDRERASADVDTFLDQLRKHGLLEG